jgi:D-galactarolactone cycloisomerase
MRIIDVECYVVRNEVSPRTGVSILYISSHSYVLVKLTDENGITGWGESYATPGVFATIETVGESLIGRDASVRSLLRDVRFSAGGIVGGGFATAALSIALEDLHARQLGVSMSTMYGGRVRDDVRVYAASGGYTEGVHPRETWPAELDRALEAGFTALKYRIGGYPIAEEATILESIRDRAPAGFDLMADGNAAYMLPDALAMGAVLGDLGFRWYEEPMVQRGGYVDYRELTQRLPVAIAGGEGLVSRTDAARFLADRTVDIVQPDPVICGGVGDALFISELAGLHGVMATPHTSNSAVGITCGIHVIGCLPNATRAFHGWEPLLEYGIDGSVWRESLLVEPHVMTDGRIPVPTGPGLGIDIDEAHLRDVAIASSRSRR